MGEGIEWMNSVALWVASLPGAVGRVTAFGTGAMLLGSAGLVVLCLLRSPLRWIGVAIAGIACLWAVFTKQPDIYVSRDAQMIAVRNPQGRLAAVKGKGDDFTLKEWLAADADWRSVGDASLGESVRCDAAGCVAPMANGGIAALSMHPSAVEEDCARAALIVTTQAVPARCAAAIVGRELSRAGGALALYRKGDGFDIVRARPNGHDRPWAKPGPAAQEETRNSIRPAQRDATPRAEDLDADD
jgi:competence protein ComEC